MSEEFSIREGPARYQMEEILGAGSTFDRLDFGYRDYQLFLNGNSFSVAFDMYADWTNPERYERNEREHLCYNFDLTNMEKIVNSMQVPSLNTENHPSADGEAGFLVELEWEEYPGHEEFAHDLYKMRETVEKVDTYLKEVENAGNRIADELSREAV